MQLLSLCTLALASAAFGAKTTPLRANAPTRQGGMGGGDTGERAAGNAAANDAEDVDVDCGENQIARTNKRGVTFCKCARGFSPDTELMEEIDDDELVCTEAISYCKSGRNYQQQKDKDCVCKGEELVWTEMPYSGKGKCVQSDWVPRCVSDRPFGGVETDDNEQPVSECRCANKKKSWDEELLQCTKTNKNGRAGANRGE